MRERAGAIGALKEHGEIKTGDLAGPFYLHIVVGKKPSGKSDQQWRRLDGNTLDDAIESADQLRKVLDATADGRKVEGGEVFNRTSIKTAIQNFLSETKKSKGPKTLAAYTIESRCQECQTLLARKQAISARLS